MQHHLRPLAAQQRVVAWRLTEGRITSIDELTLALWGNSEDGGALDAKRSIGVLVYRLREALAPHGIEIVNYHGHGWQVLRRDIPRLRDLLADEIARNVRTGYVHNPHRRRVDRSAECGVSSLPLEGAAP